MENHEKLSAVDFISSFLVRYKIVLIAIFSAVTVLLISLAVGAAVTSRFAEANAAVAEEILDAYSRFTTAEASEKEEAKITLTEALEKGKATKKGSYAFVRAVLCESQMSEEEGDEETALTILTELQNLKGNLYLIPIGLHRAAVLAEKQGQQAEALAFYKSIAKNYSQSYFNMDRVYYNMARLEETVGDKEAARKIYKKLIDSFSVKDSAEQPALVSIAKDRLIYLETATAENEENEE